LQADDEANTPEGRGFKSRPVHHKNPDSQDPSQDLIIRFRIVIIHNQNFGTLKPLRGKIIALEGIDQSGKRTQTRLLANELKKKGARVTTISFPIYKSPSGRQIQRFLEEKQEYPAAALHMLYSLNRWENQEQMIKLIQNSDFVIADRYYPSNLAYGVSRGLSLDWLQGLDRGLPTANLVVVLDVPVPASFVRKSTGRDVHERDKQLLTNVRRTYGVLAKKLDWKIVDASRSFEEVHEAIWILVRKKFRLTP
jgi:dTMP kinase